MNQSPPITAVILAGGRGSRMGGADKGLLRFQDRPLVEHARDALAPQVERILVSANRNVEQYGALGCEVVQDEPTLAGAGPLAGIGAALERCQTDYLLTVPCDAPFLNEQLAIRLWRALQHDRSLAAVAHDGERMQPVFSLLHRELRTPLRAFLHGGQRRARDFLLQQQAVAVDFSDTPAMFVNLNRPADLRTHALLRA